MVALESEEVAVTVRVIEGSVWAFRDPVPERVITPLELIANRLGQVGHVRETVDRRAPQMSHDLLRAVGGLPEPLEEGAQAGFRLVRCEVQEILARFRRDDRAGHAALQLTFDDGSKVQDILELERRATGMPGQENPYQSTSEKIRLRRSMPETA